jgi:serine/threonine-protein kinase RsbW
MSASSRVPSSDASNRVEVSVPLRTEFFATLRTVAASLGADIGFSVDEIDDLRLAISEVVTSLADGDHEPHRRVDASFELGDARLVVTLRTPGLESQLELDDLASSILASVVDEYDIAGTGITLVKSAAETARSAASDIDSTAPGGA